MRTTTRQKFPWQSSILLAGLLFGPNPSAVVSAHGPQADNAGRPLERVVDDFKVRGKIAKIDGKLITVKEDVDEQHRVRVTDMTRYTLDGRRVTFEKMRFGLAVLVVGERDGDEIIAKKIAATTVK